MIEGINEEIRLLSDKDDPFPMDNWQIQRKTSEIPPVGALATPLMPEKVNNPLPQRTKPPSEKRTDEIPPVDTQNSVQSKPPTHNNKPTRRQIEYDSMTQTNNK